MSLNDPQRVTDDRRKHTFRDARTWRSRLVVGGQERLKTRVFADGVDVWILLHPFDFQVQATLLDGPGVRSAWAHSSPKNLPPKSTVIDYLIADCACLWGRAGCSAYRPQFASKGWRTRMRAGVGRFVLAYPSGVATITDMGETVAMISSRRNSDLLKRSRNSASVRSRPPLERSIMRSRTCI